MTRLRACDSTVARRFSQRRVGGDDGGVDRLPSAVRLAAQASPAAASARAMVATLTMATAIIVVLNITPLL